ncbi:hypothetical protein AGR4B_Cc70119 [Agrobacterium tumefaciens str. CFBP 5621]|nr:hypothetical protein AGR4B_Cc70119 [Agrobacterium tumefaciens str. CFBP 5621]
MNISTRGSLNGESEELTFTVGGMDCGSCAAKIETALSRLPGVGDVKVSVARERLNFSRWRKRKPRSKKSRTRCASLASNPLCCRAKRLPRQRSRPIITTIPPAAVTTMTRPKRPLKRTMR